MGSYCLPFLVGGVPEIFFLARILLFQCRLKPPFHFHVARPLERYFVVVAVFLTVGLIDKVRYTSPPGFPHVVGEVVLGVAWRIPLCCPLSRFPVRCPSFSSIRVAPGSVP